MKRPPEHPKASDYVVAYDVAENKERGKVEKILKGYGFRAQKSVFECKISKYGYMELIRKLEGLKLKTGFVRLYRLEYSFKIESIGEIPKQDSQEIDGGAAYIV